MARQNPVVINFSGGEIDDYALARVDLQGYETCAETLLNVTLTSRGAMELAPGTLYIGTMPGVSILRPWKFTIGSSYMLELSDELVRFVFDDGYVSLDGAAASVGTWSDESAAPPAGGDPAPDGGTADITAGEEYDFRGYLLGNEGYLIP